MDNINIEKIKGHLETERKKNKILKNLVVELKSRPECQELSHIRKHIFKTSITPPTPISIVIDNFYNNPQEMREHILKQEFKVRGNYPGQRTISYATNEIKEIIQRWIYPFGGKITMFPMGEKEGTYNGSFQYTTARDRSWFHVDGWNNWAGVLYLTPNAPLNSGTGLYRFKDGTRFDYEQEIRNNKELIDNSTTDFTKWELVDKIGNVFNRLVIFNAHHFHISMDYFGHNKETGRLFQVFFFSTEKQIC
tara:strand:+ start:56 stop:805 length:750 start_codon:yes stop_codon:yes gene_type:complete